MGLSDFRISVARLVGALVVELGRRAVVVGEADARALLRVVVAAGVVVVVGVLAFVASVMATDVMAGVDEGAVLADCPWPPLAEHAPTSSTDDTTTANLRNATDTGSPFSSERSIGRFDRGPSAARVDLAAPARTFRKHQSIPLQTRVSRVLDGCALAYDGPMSALSRSEQRALPVASYRGKRFIDVVVAIVGLIVTAPVQAVVAGLIRWNMGTPVLFRQVRPGLHARPFALLKFRTMLTPEQAGNAREDADRLTPLGRRLRAASLDELPSLWNVLRGDLSLVGPRPLLLHYVPHYTPEQARRHEARPGITGLAQVSGRNALDWESRLGLDVSYVDRCSFALDAAILWRTVLPVLRRQGISAPGEATMPPFVPVPQPGSFDS